MQHVLVDRILDQERERDISGLCYVGIDFLTRRIYDSYIGEGALSSPTGGYIGEEAFTGVVRGDRHHVKRKSPP